jgi:hypothetical protein
LKSSLKRNGSINTKKRRRMLRFNALRVSRCSSDIVRVYERQTMIRIRKLNAYKKMEKTRLWKLLGALPIKVRAPMDSAKPKIMSERDSMRNLDRSLFSAIKLTLNDTSKVFFQKKKESV